MTTTTTIPELDAEDYRPSQLVLLYHHLKRAPITQPEAQRLYGIMRLGARIYELREAGFPIRRRIVPEGCRRIAEYSME